MIFQPKRCSMRNSHVIFKSSDGVDNLPGQILAIFSKATNRVDATTVHIIVREYLPLNASDEEHDRYRRFGEVGGRLYYDRTAKPSIIVAKRLVTLFAKTSLQQHGNIRDPVIHVLGIYKVKVNLG